MKYREKPIVVEAEQFFPSVHPWPEGVEGYVAERVQNIKGVTQEWNAWRIQTLEGSHIVTPGDWIITRGDWIITGIQGERYPCKPDIFEATYERVEEA